MRKHLTSDLILDVIRRLAADGEASVSSTVLLANTGGSLATLKRLLEEMTQAGALIREGRARATRYRLSTRESMRTEDRTVPEDGIEATESPIWSKRSRPLLEALNRPLAARAPVTYQRKLVDDYVPNESSLLPRDIAQTLVRQGRLQGQQPAGTYARKVLEHLLIDLSWSSSRLEGNRYTLLQTQELFESGVQHGGSDAVMLLNHKRAIEFIVDAAPNYGLTTSVIRNLHAILMQDLLTDSESLGAIRKKVVNITDTTYVPTQIPSLLDEMLGVIVQRARLINNPVESAFFLWVNLAYLQPFEDGNKRTSRLSANIPLMLYNCAPLSFLDVDPQDYAHAMVGVYELLDVSLAVDLFVWTYRRSLQKYAVVLQSVSAPDAFRVEHRERLNEGIQAVVHGGATASAAVSSLALPTEKIEPFSKMLREELSKLTVYNCARYRLTMKTVEDWINRGRPL